MSGMWKSRVGKSKRVKAQGGKTPEGEGGGEDAAACLTQADKASEINTIVTLISQFISTFHCERGLTISYFKSIKMNKKNSQGSVGEFLTPEIEAVAKEKLLLLIDQALLHLTRATVVKLSPKTIVVVEKVGTRTSAQCKFTYKDAMKWKVMCDTLKSLLQPSNITVTNMYLNRMKVSATLQYPESIKDVLGGVALHVVRPIGYSTESERDNSGRIRSAESNLLTTTYTNGAGFQKVAHGIVNTGARGEHEDILVMDSHHIKNTRIKDVEQHMAVMSNLPMTPLIAKSPEFLSSLNLGLYEVDRPEQLGVFATRFLAERSIGDRDVLRAQILEEGEVRDVTHDDLYMNIANAGVFTAKLLFKEKSGAEAQVKIFLLHPRFHEYISGAAESAKRKPSHSVPVGGFLITMDCMDPETPERIAGSVVHVTTVMSVVVASLEMCGELPPKASVEHKVWPLDTEEVSAVASSAAGGSAAVGGSAPVTTARSRLVQPSGSGVGTRWG